jgi:hypothetical protein
MWRRRFDLREYVVNQIEAQMAHYFRHWINDFVGVLE